MSRIDFETILCVEYDGKPLLERCKYTRAPETLLREAIRFYNYGLAPQDFVTKKEWEPFTPETVRKGILELSGAVIKAVVQKMRLLLPNSPKHNKTLKQHLRQSAIKDDLNNSAYQGLYAVLPFLSFAGMNPEKLRQLWNTVNGPKKVHFREFGYLKRLVTEDLYPLVRQENIQAALSSQYATDRKIAAEYLFEPYWGGGWTISTIPTAEHPPLASVGPTEKLYYCFCSDIFTKAHKLNLSRKVIPGKNRAMRCRFLETVSMNVGKIELTLPSRPTPKWLVWQSNLDYLEVLFKLAIQLNKNLPWKDNLGIKLGLPVALGLIGILRAYIADLAARTLMTSFPLALDDIYRKVNGYAAVAFWEALSGKCARNANDTECLLNHRNWGMVGRLKDWRSFPLSDSWDDGGPISTAAKETFKEILKKPVAEKLYGLESYDEYLPRYPAITPDFYKAAGYTLKNPLDIKRSGARFFAQMHIFVATQILKKGLTKLELKVPEKKEEKKKHRRALENFRIGAGSYLWGGKKPPHQTHRDGACFDFSFGPVLPCWPVFNLAAELKELGEKQADVLSRKEIKNFLSGKENGRFGFVRNNVYKQTLAICYTHKAGKQAKTNPPPPQRIVFRVILRKLIFAELKKLYAKCDKTLDGEDDKLNDEEKAELFGEEEKNYEEVEKALFGTPHFIDPTVAKRVPEEEVTTVSDRQRTHIGHVAILLSAPRNIVFASPIVHVRAMRAIREAFRVPVHAGDVQEATSNTVMLADASLDIDDYYNDMQIQIISNAGISQKRTITVYCGIDRVATVDKPWDTQPTIGDSFQIFDISCFKLATEIVRCTSFSFLPHNHHHHWHVDYLPPWGRRDCKRYWTMDPVERIRYFSPLWLSMGIDLSPFLRYLEEYKIQNQKDKLLKNVVDEYKDVVEVCKEYQEEYVKRYGTEKQPKKDSIQKTDELLERLFSQFKENSDLLRPTISREHLAGKRDSKVMKEAGQYSMRLLRELITLDLIEAVGAEIAKKFKEAVQKGLQSVLSEEMYEMIFGRDEKDID